MALSVQSGRRRKFKKVRVSRSAALEAEKSHYGDEHVWVDTDTATEFGQALYWYRVFATDKKRKTWLGKYAAKIGISAEQVAKIEDVAGTFNAGPEFGYDWTSYAHYARMIMRGCPFFTEEDIKKTKRFLTTCIDFYDRREAEKANAPAGPSVRERMDKIADGYRLVLDQTIDGIMDGSVVEDFDVQTWMTQKEIAVSYVPMLVEHIQPTITEMTSEEEDYVEAYEFLGDRKTEAASKIQKLIDEINLYGENLQKAKAPRRGRQPKKKIVTSEMKVSRLRYLKADSSHNMTSFHPEKILKAKEMIIFDVNGLYVSHYFAADDSEGLDVDGINIRGFDPKRSYYKKVRKGALDDFVKNVNGSSARKKIAGWIAELTTAPTFDCSGRPNNNTILWKYWV